MIGQTIHEHSEVLVKFYCYGVFHSPDNTLSCKTMSCKKTKYGCFLTISGVGILEFAKYYSRRIIEQLD